MAVFFSAQGAAEGSFSAQGAAEGSLSTQGGRDGCSQAQSHRLDSTPNINELLQGNPNLWRGCDMAGQGYHGRSTGFDKLDALLPGRGWPDRGMVEVISPRWGMGELQLLLPLMRQITEQGQWILCISPPHGLYAPALEQAGIDSSKLLVVSVDSSCKDALWSMEKALQTADCGLVLAWQNWLPQPVLRRLQLAADTGNTLGVLIKRRVSEYSHSSMRLKIQETRPPYQEDASHVRTDRFAEAEVTVLKAKGNFRPLSTRLQLFRPAVRRATVAAQSHSAPLSSASSQTRAQTSQALRA
jgi:cell division inhibitor SulA